MFNEALAEMKRTGKYDQIVNKYIKDGSTTAEKADSVSEKGIIGILKNNYGVLLSGLLRTIGLALLSFAFAIDSWSNYWFDGCLTYQRFTRLCFCLC